MAWLALLCCCQGTLPAHVRLRSTLPSTQHSMLGTSRDTHLWYATLTPTQPRRADMKQQTLKLIHVNVKKQPC
jgi:hypothetical protein